MNWIPVLGDEQFLEVSEDFSSIRKKEILITQNNGYGNIYARKIKSKILKIGVDDYGYYQITFRFQSIQNNRRVHRIIYETFVLKKKIPKGLVIDHIDGNPKNNALVNLRLVSESENRFNQRGRKNSSGHRGLRKIKNVKNSSSSQWQAYISKDRKNYYKCFERKVDAIAWRKKMAYNLYGELVIQHNDTLF